MSEEKPKDSANQDSDKELADLLDSALNDFKNEPDKATGDTSKKEEDKATDDAEVSDEWTDELIQQATSQFESNLASLLGNIQGDPASQNQIEAKFKEMAEAAQQVFTNPVDVSGSANDFASTITQTLQGLSEGRENLQNPFSGQDIMSMFNPGGAGPGGDDQNAFLPFMQGMMQSLLSKEVLYPSLKDILDKFPDWLRDNDATLKPEEKERYVKQKELMEQVCGELEAETPEEPADVKRTRFEKVLGLMQKLQDYGHPPSDLVGEEMPSMMPTFDQMQNPDQCSVI